MLDSFIKFESSPLLPPGFHWLQIGNVLHETEATPCTVSAAVARMLLDANQTRT